MNQPLAAVVTNGEVSLRLLDREPLDLAEIRAAVTDMVTAGRRASDIIKRLRALFRKAETEAVPLDINGLILEIVPLVQHELINKEARLSLDLADLLPAVLGDSVQLQQVILNLLLNGAEAMELVVGRPRDLVIRSRIDGANVLVAVEDSGVGIDEVNVAQLFEPFHTTKSGGMGMGLTICRSIIANHGGKLWASANPGPGATFRFSLPVAGVPS